MKTTRKNDTVTIELSVEEAALVAAYIMSAREAPLVELGEQLCGSPLWKQRRAPKTAHQGVIDPATYARIQEKYSL